MTVSAAEDDTWLSKKYERLQLLEFPNVLTSDFDNTNFKTTYSQLGKNGYNVTFCSDSIHYYTFTNLEGVSQNKVFARIEDTNDSITVNCNFSNIDVIRFHIITGHSIQECNKETHNAIGDSNAKFLDIHLLDSFKSSGSTSLMISYELFPEPACIYAVSLLTEDTAGTFTVEKLGDVYFKDSLNRYEYYTYDIAGSGTSDSSSTGSSESSSTSSSDSSSTIEEQYENITISLFDGSVDTKVPSNSGSKVVNGVTIEWVGMSSGTSFSPITVNGKAYRLAWKNSGQSSASKYIKFNIPKNVVEFSFYTVVAPDGTSAVDVGIGENLLYTTGNKNSEYTFNTSDVYPSGDYNLTFSKTARIAEISLNLKIDPNYVEPTTPVDPTDTVYPLTVAFGYQDDNNQQQVLFVTPKTDENFNIDTFELPVPEVSGTFEGWFLDNGTFQDEFTLEDFKNLDFNADYDYEHKQISVYAKIVDSKPVDSSTAPSSSSSNKEDKDDKENGNGSSQIKDFDDFHFDLSQWSFEDLGKKIAALLNNPENFFEEVGKAFAKAPFVQTLHLILKIIVAVVVGFLLFKVIKALVELIRG